MEGEDETTHASSTQEQEQQQQSDHGQPSTPVDVINAEENLTTTTQDETTTPEQTEQETVTNTNEDEEVKEQTQGEEATLSSPRESESVLVVSQEELLREVKTPKKESLDQDSETPAKESSGSSTSTATPTKIKSNSVQRTHRVHTGSTLLPPLPTAPLLVRKTTFGAEFAIRAKSNSMNAGPLSSPPSSLSSSMPSLPSITPSSSSPPSVKSPRTPRTPKTPKTPKSPRTPRNRAFSPRKNDEEKEGKKKKKKEEKAIKKKKPKGDTHKEHKEHEETATSTTTDSSIEQQQQQQQPLSPRSKKRTYSSSDELYTSSQEGLETEISSGADSLASSTEIASTASGDTSDINGGSGECQQVKKVPPPRPTSKPPLRAKTRSRRDVKSALLTSKESAAPTTSSPNTSPNPSPDPSDPSLKRRSGSIGSINLNKVSHETTTTQQPDQQDQLDQQQHSHHHQQQPQHHPIHMSSQQLQQQLSSEDEGECEILEFEENLGKRAASPPTPKVSKTAKRKQAPKLMTDWKCLTKDYSVEEKMSAFSKSSPLLFGSQPKTATSYILSSTPPNNSGFSFKQISSSNPDKGFS